jgi:hypothetical protein
MMKDHKKIRRAAQEWLRRAVDGAEEWSGALRSIVRGLAEIRTRLDQILARVGDDRPSAIGGVDVDTGGFPMGQSGPLKRNETTRLVFTVQMDTQIHRLRAWGAAVIEQVAIGRHIHTASAEASTGIRRARFDPPLELGPGQELVLFVRRA